MRWPGSYAACGPEDGEVVEYPLTCTEDGIAHADHHVHLVTVGAGLIVADTVLYGGPWPGQPLAELASVRA